ncbi:MAG: UDP-N-acetylmuramoyl-L-alanine--D-glutamate ligase [Chloroflexi bacterium]|nr:UDP-N-acetylmuramoyl-L-alanine--D-glutamate ligase [Chloroflexota bacterium]
MDFRGTKVTILGLAREGVDLAQYLCQQGALVRVSDRKSAADLGHALEALRGCPVEYNLGGHPLEPVLDAAVLFVSPGIPQELPAIQEARRRGVRVSSATELLLDLAPCPVVGITGSSGKTTTTALVGEMFGAAGRHALVGGNIGVPLLGRLHELGPDSWLVLELSSFQLETVQRSPHVAAITNLTPNHLDRHETMAAYAAAKERIFRFQRPGDWAVLNAEDPGSAAFAPPGRVLRFGLGEALVGRIEGAYLEGDELVVRVGDRQERVCRAGEVRLRGRHNLANVLTACAVATAAGLELEAMRAVATSFTGVAHRLQEVARYAGVCYVDDSIATSPERSMAALRAYDEPIVLIAGGRDKHLPMQDWARLIVERVRHVVLLGEMSDLVERAVREADPAYRALSRAASMDEAVAQAERVACPGDVVLLSPGGTSFDMFADFEARGQAFAEAARKLGQEARGTRRK